MIFSYVHCLRKICFHLNTYGTVNTPQVSRDMSAYHPGSLYPVPSHFKTGYQRKMFLNLPFPENINYELRGNNLIGDIHIPGGEKLNRVDYRSPGAAEDGETLVINISQVLGDIEIIS